MELAGAIRGLTNGRDDLDLGPDVTINLQGDQIVGVLGKTGDNVITSLGFWTRSGAQHGPYGGTTGSAFSFTGTVHGFFGGVYSSDRRLSGVGFWTDAPSPPPAPPAVPLNPTPPPPRDFRLRSPLYGRGGSEWTDMSNADGQPLQSIYNKHYNDKNCTFPVRGGCRCVSRQSFTAASSTRH
jgi:hypothetical protein